MLEEATSFPAHCKRQRWVADDGGQIVATGWYLQFAGRYHPQKFKREIFVHPDHQRRGIGGALYNTIIQALEPFDPIALNTTAREDFAAGLADLERVEQ